jgi:hypothetical protein
MTSVPGHQKLQIKEISQFLLRSSPWYIQIIDYQLPLVLTDGLKHYFSGDFSPSSFVNSWAIRSDENDNIIRIQHKIFEADFLNEQNLII